MSSPDPSAGPLTVEEQLALALQRAAVEGVLSASRTYLTACFAIFGWDFVLTFPDEYRTMWRADRWTPVRVAFFLNRYGGLLNIVSFMCLFWFKIGPKTCDKIHLLQPIPSSILLTICHFLLGVRVCALWKNQRSIPWFLGILATCGVVVQIWVVIPNRALPLPPGLRGCFSGSGDRNHDYLWAYWIPPVVYDTIATILVLVPLIKHWRNTPRTRLLTIFARDGLIYFVVVLISYLVNAIYFSIPSVVNPALNVPLPLAFTPMMASRIVLHLRTTGSDANSQDRRTSSSGSSGRRNNMLPKPGSHNQSREREVQLQSLGRRIESGLPVSYDGMVHVETGKSLEKNLEPSPHVGGPDECSLSEYSIQTVVKNQ
ncbi:hypothetical protein BT69DRAFT_1347421 [Atractiella rhizophila]|nr:hypothetical protein BT69DRAFT_1347421 [Atractiella rhizophila]